jgi:hypothetical protein
MYQNQTTYQQVIQHFKYFFKKEIKRKFLNKFFFYEFTKLELKSTTSD